MRLPSLAPLIARLRAEDGQDLIEYPLLVLLIAVAVIVVLIVTGEQINDLWQTIVDVLGAALGS